MSHFFARLDRYLATLLALPTSLMGQGMVTQAVPVGRRRAQNEAGQSLVEYGLVLSLLAVACIGVLILFGTEIAASLSQTSTALQQATPQAVERVNSTPVCNIKGLMVQERRVYVLPHEADYDRLNLDPTRGDRWFCSEQDSLQAGWTPLQGKSGPPQTLLSRP